MANRCGCGVPIDVSHFCSALDHAWIGRRLTENPHAVALGKKGGSATSKRKAKASRDNGKEGRAP